MDPIAAALTRYWGWSTFRPLQREAVVASLEVHCQAYFNLDLCAFSLVESSVKVGCSCREGMR